MGYSEPLLSFNEVSKIFNRGGVFSWEKVHAVRNVSFALPHKPSIVAIVGESGSGKTTLARMILRLIEPSFGEILLDGKRLWGRRRETVPDLAFRLRVQPIFQNPFEAFSLHLPVEFYLLRTAVNLGAAPDTETAIPIVTEALRSVGLELDSLRGKFVQQFSGGQLQRIAIARALIPRPGLIVADEPVSMVDASLRMTIINLFGEIRDQHGVSIIYITHDLSTATYIADQIMIMSKGEIIEQGPPDKIINNPSHDYTRLLLNSIPRIGNRWSELE